MKKISYELKVGDTLKMIWCNNKIIKDFETYDGVFDFVERIAIFVDNTKMSIVKDEYYEIVKF